MRHICIVYLILACVSAQAQRLIHSPAPAWAEIYDYHDKELTAEASNGYRYLLVSIQNHLESKEFYKRYAMKVISEEGLSTVSSINLSFDPSFQKLILHTLKIVRDGKTIDKLDVSKFEVFRREEEMDRAVYDKTLNAVYNLPDVRVGDIIDYSYSIRGANPVFNDHSFSSLYLQYGVPVNKFGCRLIFDDDRNVQLKTFGDTGTPRESRIGSLKVLEWVRENVPALLTDDMLPSWFDPYPHVQYSDFGSWEDVKAWAANVFDTKKSTNPKLRQLVQDILSLETDLEGKIKECIRIVQADIRYLSFSDGIHSYKPHSPGMVYDQKYGDCKDKSLLLSYLLNELHIKSSPSLVSTENGQTIPEILPTPWAFNHCIVQFTFNDSTYWIDPTLRTQVGKLRNYFIPSYQHALVINGGGPGVDVIPPKDEHSRISVVEEYTIDEIGGYVNMKVESKYYGDEADDMRRYFTVNTKEEIHKNYLNFYASDFAEISLERDVEYHDDKAANVIIASEEYLLKDFWTADPEKGKTASVYARLMSSYLNKPETKLRTMPLFLSHPRNISQTIKIYLPEEWNVDDYNNRIETDAFVYTGSTFYHDKVITLRYTYRTKAPFVETAHTAEHIDKIGDVLDDLNFVISYQTDEPESSFTRQFVVVALIAAAGIYFVRKKFR